MFILFVTFLWNQPDIIMGSEVTDNPSQGFQSDINYDEIQEVLDDILEDNESFDFGTYVKNMISGEVEFSFESVKNQVGQVIKNEIDANKSIVIRLISIAIIAAVFTNFTTIFQNNQVAETGFYVTYLLLFSILTSSFFVVSTLAGETLTKLLDFMKVLIPAYFMTVAFSSGAGTSMVFYESTLVLIFLVDVILIKVLIPLINIYFMLVLANNLSKEDMISKLTELLETIIGWTLKTLVGAVIGFNGIQGLILPAADRVKKSVLTKATSALPGVGNVLSSVTETVMGAGVLVKNAIGVGGLIVIIMICMIPLLKLILFVLIYKFGVAIVQPISDKRIMNCINASAQGARLLLYTVSIGAILFLFTIAIISASTNLSL